MSIETRIQHKRDTASNWATANLALLDGEIIVVNDNGKRRLKVGTGATYSSTDFLDADAAAHIANTGNPHGVTKAQLDLGNVDNTADANKTVKAAGTADKLSTARTITLSGDVSGTASFDGSENITITATVADDSHAHVISNVDGLQSALDGKLSTTGTAAKATADASGNNIVNTYATKTEVGTDIETALGLAQDYTDEQIAAKAYVLPNATTSTLGGVKVGTNISVSSGTISVANGSTSAKGVLQLTNSTSSTSTTTAATPAAVKSAYDLANGKQSPATTLSGYGITDAYTKTEVDTKVAGLVDSAPEALNTLNELAAALGDDPNFATTMSTAIGKKANSADLAKVATSGSYNDLSDKPTIPTSLPANGGNAATVGGFTVGTNVPADAVFTDTVYTHPTYTAKSSGLYKITVNSLGHVSAATSVVKSDITGLGIPAQDTVYTHPSHTAKSSGLYKITVDALGHVSAATAVAKSDITGLGIPAQDTVYTHPSSHAASMITGLATVATSGSYNDLSNKPSIPAVTKVTFTASDSKWGALANGRYPLTISASGGEFLNCYRTNGSNYDKMDVNVTVSGNNIIIYSLDKFAGYMTYLK